MAHESSPVEERQPDEEVKKPDGVRWLELLGEEDLIGTLIPHFRDGRQLYAEEFDKLCGEHARPIFLAIEKDLEAARALLHHYLDEPAGKT